MQFPLSYPLYDIFPEAEGCTVESSVIMRLNSNVHNFHKELKIHLLIHLQVEAQREKKIAISYQYDMEVKKTHAAILSYYDSRAYRSRRGFLHKHSCSGEARIKNDGF